MPRPKNPIETASLAFQAMPWVLQYLDQLVQKQLYGSTRADVVRRLVEERLRLMVKEGDVEEVRPASARKPRSKRG